MLDEKKVKEPIKVNKKYRDQYYKCPKVGGPKT